MKKFRVTEVFYSVQGEGQFVGVPSVFLRVFGCNFKCEGFGMPVGEPSKERLNINPNDYYKFLKNNKLFKNDRKFYEELLKKI